MTPEERAAVISDQTRWAFTDREGAALNAEIAAVIREAVAERWGEWVRRLEELADELTPACRREVTATIIRKIETADEDPR